MSNTDYGIHSFSNLYNVCKLNLSLVFLSTVILPPFYGGYEKKAEIILIISTGIMSVNRKVEYICSPFLVKLKNRISHIDQTWFVVICTRKDVGRCFSYLPYSVINSIRVSLNFVCRNKITLETQKF